MFPYKIRKPAWGSLKPRAAAAGGLVGDPDDPHAVGGNLQRAILSDLIELRGRYRDRLALPPSSVRPAGSGSGGAPRRRRPSSTSPHRRRHDHVALGSYFADFKCCFREARFGAMHTRAVPPRVDRGEYVQLLYSSCLYLLEEGSSSLSLFDDDDDDDYSAIADSEPPSRWSDDGGDDDGGGGGGAASSPPPFFDAIYAVFALYALHRTNVLPKAPRRRPIIARRTTTTPPPPGEKIDERSLSESWSMLPIVIIGDEDKLHRRTYLSPVRIDAGCYALLLRLRGACLARAERCGVDATTMAMANATDDDDDDAADDGNGGGRCDDDPPPHRRCYCGLARDAAHVIDAMLCDDSFFDYCEYHGPQGLEGLAGSPNFYRAHFANNNNNNNNNNAPPRKRKSNVPSKDAVAAAIATAPSAMTKSELNAIGHGDGILDSLDLRNLCAVVESHCSNLDSVVSKLRMCRSTDDILRPKQRELVENTLRGIANRPAYVELVDELNTDKASISISTDVVSGAASEANPPPEAQPTDTKQVLLLKFPENFSPFGDIDFTDEFIAIKEAVAKENRARSKGGSIFVDVDMNVMHPELACFDCLNENTMDDDDLRSAAVQRRKKRRREPDTFFELHQEGIRDDGTSNNTLDEVSIVTGQGKNALLSLLSMSKGNEDYDDIPTDIFGQDDDVSIATGAGKNALLSLLSMAGGACDSDHLDDEFSPSDDDDAEPRSMGSYLNSATQLTLNDDASVTSGIGKRALQFLLSGQADDRKVKSRPTKKAPSRKSRSRVSKVNAQQKSVKKKKMPPLPSMKATQPKAINEKRLEDGTCSEDDEDASSYGEFSVATEEDAGRKALAALLSNTETVEV